MIYSEIGQLKQVLVHKPIYALGYLTPKNCHQYLFDDVLWVDRAIQEHDQFVQQLRHAGVEVLLLHELLEQVLQQPAARAWLVQARLQALPGLKPYSEALERYLHALTPAALTECLLGGLLRHECSVLEGHLADLMLSDHDVIIPPLPNQLYMRDSSCWIGEGLVLASMKYSVRRGEAINLNAIYRFHPRFNTATPRQWFDGTQASPQPFLEGGDVLVLNQRTVLVGISQRTSPEAVEMLAKSLLQRGRFEQVFAIELPDARRYMHLDVVMTMVRQDTFVTALSSKVQLPVWRLRCGDTDALVIETVSDFAHALAQALEVPKVYFIELRGDHYTLQREQWTAAANLLTLAPGHVIAYDRNTVMNRTLKNAGLIVHEIESAELSRGRGGARCMSCPIAREAL